MTHPCPACGLKRGLAVAPRGSRYCGACGHRWSLGVRTPSASVEDKAEPGAVAEADSPTASPWVYLLLELRPGKDPDPLGLFSSEEAAEAEVEWRGAGEFVARKPDEDSRWDQEWLQHTSARPVRLVLTRLRLRE